MESELIIEPNSSAPAGASIVWFAEVPASIDSDVLAQLESVLGEEEVRRYRSFQFAEDRQLYLAAHAFLRTCLSRYAKVAPEDWRFECSEFGRPEIAADQPHAGGIRFNLSHTRGLVACVITQDRKVGIDVERLGRGVNQRLIASRYFTSQESEDIFSCPDEQRSDRFFEYWTLKEAFVKARGGGLTIPLDEFSFDQSADGSWCVNIRNILDTSEAWQFFCLRRTIDHVLSVAVHVPDHRTHDLDVNRMPLDYECLLRRVEICECGRHSPIDECLFLGE